MQHLTMVATTPQELRVEPKSGGAEMTEHDLMALNASSRIKLRTDRGAVNASPIQSRTRQMTMNTAYRRLELNSVGKSFIRTRPLSSARNGSATPPTTAAHGSIFDRANLSSMPQRRGDLGNDPPSARAASKSYRMKRHPEGIRISGDATRDCFVQHAV